MRRSIVVLTGVALLSGGLFTIAPPAAAVTSDSATAVPLTNFTDIVMDDAHGHVFLAGAADDPIVVRDLDGGAVGTIADQAGATQMSLSPDGSRLYVALAGADAISAIDTTTLLETARYSTGVGTCPSSVAATGTKVWFGYGCVSGEPNLGVLNPTGVGTVTLATRPAGSYPDPPLLEASPTDAGFLAVASARSSSPSSLSLLDVSSGTPALVAKRSVVGALTDLAWSRDGSHVLTASKNAGYHGSFLAPDLSADGAYAGPDHVLPNAVAAGPDGAVAAGLGYIYTSLSIRTYAADGTRAREYLFGNDVGFSPYLLDRGLAYGADGRLYAVTWGSGQPMLRVLLEPPLAPSGFSIFTPSIRTVNQTSVINGQIRTHLAPPAGSVVTIQRDGPDGLVDLPSVTTGDEGRFTFTDKPLQRGTYGYTASWAGDAEHLPASRRVEWVVKGITPSFSIIKTGLYYAYGTRVALRVHLGANPESPVDVWAQPYGGAKTLVAHGVTDTYGDFRTSYVVTRNGGLSATYAGNDWYEPAGAGAQVFSTAKMLSSYSGYYGTYGSFKLFKTSVDPKFLLTVLPNNAHATVDYTIQTYTSSTQTWHTKAHVTRQLDAYSKSSLVYVTTPPAGTRFRIRAHLAATNLSTETTGPYLYGMFKA